ncbi:hypothetical protein Tco_0520659 [Tanacetum coccineum]
MNGHSYLFFQYFASFWGRVLGPEIIAHSIGMIMLLRNVTVSPSTGNFSIPIIPLCWDGDLTTKKFIHAEVECPSSPIFTSKDIWPSGQMVSPLNPVRYAVSGTIWLLISGRSLTKQCSYKISEDAPPSTYIRCTKCPPISASMIIGPSNSVLVSRGGNEILLSPGGRNLWLSMVLLGALVPKPESRIPKLGRVLNIVAPRWHCPHLSVFACGMNSFIIGLPGIPTFCQMFKLGSRNLCPWESILTPFAVFALRIFRSVFFGMMCPHDDAFLSVPRFPLLGNSGGDYQNVYTHLYSEDVWRMVTGFGSCLRPWPSSGLCPGQVGVFDLEAPLDFVDHFFPQCSAQRMWELLRFVVHECSW